MNIAIVYSSFNDEVTSRMLEVARERAKLKKITIKCECAVPGAYDMPVIVDALLQRNGIDAVVTLGAIIRGQTRHDEVIAHSAARALSALSIKYGKAVSLGISGPGMHTRHAYARIRPVAERAVDAADSITKELGRIRRCSS